MPSYIMEEANFIPVPEDQWLAAELVECKLVIKEYLDDAGQNVRKLNFKFKITEPGRVEGQWLWGETPTRFNDHPDCKLRAWAQEISGREFRVGEQLDTDVLIGMGCRIIAAGRDYEKDGDAKRHVFVKDVMRSRESMMSVPAFNEPF